MGSLAYDIIEKWMPTVFHGRNNKASYPLISGHRYFTICLAFDGSLLQTFWPKFGNFSKGARVTQSINKLTNLLASFAKIGTN